MSGLNGRPAIKFTRNTGLYTPASVSTTGMFPTYHSTIFAAFSTTVANTVIFGMSYNGAGNRLCLGVSNNQLIIRTDPGDKLSGGGGASDGRAHIACLFVNNTNDNFGSPGAGSIRALYQDGTLVGSDAKASLGSLDSERISMGTWGVYTGTWTSATSSSTVGEVLLYNSSLSDEQRFLVNEYLGLKYGVNAVQW